MALKTIEDREHAISLLTPRQMEKLYGWLDRHHRQPLNARIETDLAAVISTKLQIEN